MASRVAEIMNKEIYRARPDWLAERILDDLLHLEITAAPVLDTSGKPLGVISIRDTLKRTEGLTARDRMSCPAFTVQADASVREAARAITDRGYHHAIVVNDRGEAVGVVSLVDFVRALLGRSTTHPPAFPHYDKKLGITWTDDLELELAQVQVAPSGPGVVMLISGGSGAREEPVWVEQCSDVRLRLRVLLHELDCEAPHLAKLLTLGHLRFRAASILDDGERERAVQTLAAHCVQ